MAQGTSDTRNVVVAKPISVVGGVFVCTRENAAKIKDHISDIRTNNDLTSLGYITEDAVKRSIERDTEDIQAWGGDTLVTTRKGASATLEFSVAEYLNVAAQRLLYGEANVKVEDGPPVTVTILGKLNEIPPHTGLVIVVNSDNAVGTIVYPDFQAQVSGDFELKDDALNVVPLTGSLFPNTDGEFFREYWEKKA